MALAFRLRDFLRPPRGILQAVGVRGGMTVLDFGCGPGGFAAAAAGLVGPGGRVYALDIHPLALKFTARLTAERGLQNLQVITDLADLPAASVDLVLLYDVLHHLPEPKSTLVELRRRLKPSGLLSIRDHHWREKKIMAAILQAGGFRFFGRAEDAFQFQREAGREES